MLGTKWPSITSRWIEAAPAASTARTSSPSLAKSDARIDGAMTSGRDANWADMGAGSEVTLDARGGPPRNMGKARRQCAADRSGGAENSAAGAAIAGERDPPEV